jgi:hypothetical protein
MRDNPKISIQIVACAVMILATSLAMAFDVSKIPFKSKETKAKILKDFEQAQERGRNFILAIGRDGAWSSKWLRSDWESHEESARMVREKCEHLSDGACNVVYQNGEWIDFENSSRTLEYVTIFDASKIPFVQNDTRAKLASKYSPESKNKALAISRHGRYWYVYSMESPQEAADSALKKCSGGKNRPCFVYAINDEVVFDSGTDIYPN